MSHPLWIKICVWVVGYIMLVPVAGFDGWAVLCGYFVGVTAGSLPIR